jgi:hypothetical protein
MNLLQTNTVIYTGIINKAINVIVFLNNFFYGMFTLPALLIRQPPEIRYYQWFQAFLNYQTRFFLQLPGLHFI